MALGDEGVGDDEVKETVDDVLGDDGIVLHDELADGGLPHGRAVVELQVPIWLMEGLEDREKEGELRRVHLVRGNFERQRAYAWAEGGLDPQRPLC